MAEPKDYARRLVKGSTIIFVALIIAGVTGLVLRMFLMRFLTVPDYGLFYLVFVLVSFLALFRELGLNSALAKHIPEFMIKKRFGEIKSSIAATMLFQSLFALPITLVLFIFSDQIAMAFCGTLAGSIVIKFLSLWFFMMVFFHAFRASFQGFQDAVTFAGMEIFYILLTFILVVFSVHVFSLGVGGVAFAYLIAALILVIVWLAIFHKKHPKIIKEKIRIKKPLIRKMWKFALPVFIGGMGALLMTYTDTIMIGIFRDTTQVGYYQAAQPLAYLLSYFPAALGIVLLPITSELWARRKKKLLGRATHFLMKFSFMIIIPAVFVFMIFPGTVLLSFAGKADYVAAAATLQILTVAIIATTPWGILQCVASGIGKPIIVTKAVFVMASLNFIGNLVLIPLFGIEGAAMATFISALVGLFLILYLMRKFVKFTMPTSSILKMLGAGLLTLLLLFDLKSTVIISPWWLEAIIVVIPSLLFYAALILAMRAINRDDLRLLKGVVPIPKRLARIIEKFVRR